MAQYTQAQINEVIRQVNAGETTAQQLEAMYGMPAAQIQANVDAANLASGFTAMPPPMPLSNSASISRRILKPQMSRCHRYQFRTL